MDAISFVFGEKTSSLRVKTVKVCKYMYVLLVLEYNTLVLLHKWIKQILYKLIGKIWRISHSEVDEWTGDEC